MNKVIALGVLLASLALAGCNPATSSFDRSGPEYHDGYGQRVQVVGGYGHSHARRRSGPNCGPDGRFSEQHGKCIGTEVHDIELSTDDKATLSSCERIERRSVMRGDRLVHYQKGINCQRPQGSSRS